MALESFLNLWRRIRAARRAPKGVMMLEKVSENGGGARLVFARTAYGKGHAAEGGRAPLVINVVAGEKS
ncbi:MAG: hypothetical protein LBU11_01175 [Zoogloeaceae bacterium]|nr:hypothetical protein [Zoogloeaceae bacterium]